MSVASFVDVESLLIGALSAAFPDARVLTILPAKLETFPQVIQVERIGGGDVVESMDAATVDIECFCQGPDPSGRVAAKQLAGQLRKFMRGLPGYRSSGAVVANVLTSVGPSERPYGNPNVFRVAATYQVIVHNQF